MATIGISAQFFWHHQDGEGNLCDTCNEPVYGQMYIPVMQLGEAVKLDFSDVDVKICESCYYLLPKEKQ